MSWRDYIFCFLLVITVILAFIAYYLDYLTMLNNSQDLFYITICIELLAVGIFAFAVNLPWPSTLTKILSLCFFSGMAMLIMIEIENIRISIEFLRGVIIFSIAFVLIALTFILLWPRKKNNDDLFDVKIIEVKPIK